MLGWGESVLCKREALLNYSSAIFYKIMVKNKSGTA